MAVLEGKKKKRKKGKATPIKNIKFIDLAYTDAHNQIWTFANITLTVNFSVMQLKSKEI